MNVFNPGDGQLVADALRHLEAMRSKLRSSRGVVPLRYAIRLFGSHAHTGQLGEGLEALLDPDRQVGEDDEFTLISENHLLPKLIFTRNSVDEFLDRPEQFSAHISLFLEQFGVRVRLGRIERCRRGSYVRGLVEEPETVASRTGGYFGWFTALRPEQASSAGADEHLLVRSIAKTQQLQASLASGEPVPEQIAPVSSLQLRSEEQALIERVHSVSDWVLTVDRNLGLDYFDSPAQSRDSVYLLDFAPEYLQGERQRLLLTTKSGIELESLVQPALHRFGLPLVEGGELAVLEALRSLSGRLALRLLASPNQCAEIVGLLLARWLLEQNGLLEDRVLIPLDAHLDWFAADGHGEEGLALSQRADLLLVGFDPLTSTIRMLIVEVKLREMVSDPDRGVLYGQMRDQSEASVTRLRELFDPEFYDHPRADEPLRSKELSTALAFYIRRAQRYRIMDSQSAVTALDYVQQLDDGYHLDLRTMGIVFERSATGSHVDEDEPGYSVHRFGLDVASRLLTDAIDRFSIGSVDSDSLGSTDGSGPGGGPSPSPGPEFDSLRDSVGAQPSLGRHHPSSGRRSHPREPIEWVEPESGLAVVAAGEESSSKAGVNEPGSVASQETEGSRASQTDEVAPPAYNVTDASGTKQEEQPVPGDRESSSRSEETSSTYDPASNEEDLSRVAEGPREEGGFCPDILLGANEWTPQSGILGKFSDAKVAIDLTGCNTISLFGVQGFGKSYTLGVIAEMATAHVEGINSLPSPLATVIFHYHKSDAYPPEFAAASEPNSKAREIDRLMAEYGAQPLGLSDVLLLAPEAKVEERRREFPSIEVAPIKFSSGELGAESWKFLLGAYGNDSLYIRQLVAIMRRHRSDLTLARFREEIEDAELPKGMLRLAEDRLALAEPYIDDSFSLQSLLHPGRTIIVDLRDEWIEKEEALGLFVVMMRIFASSRFEGQDFNKLVVFDEAHKYITESNLIGQVVETIREMRHQATSVVIASQDPLSVPRAVIELTSVLLLHRMTSPQWLKHLKTAISALDGVGEGYLTALQPGEALIWAQRSTDRRFTERPQKIQVRPRFSQHGGGTRTAVSGATIR